MNGRILLLGSREGPHQALEQAQIIPRNLKKKCLLSNNNVYIAMDVRFM